MSIIHGNLMLGARKGERSLRFYNNRYLSRAISSTGSRRIATLSVWLKKSQRYGSTRVLQDTIVGGSAEAADFIGFTGAYTFDNNRIIVSMNNSFDCYLVTTRRFIDNAAWGHLVVAIDTTQAVDSDRLKIYWNGSQITSFVVARYPTMNYDFIDWNLSGKNMLFGAIAGPTFGFNGYMAHLYWIDGQQLTASSFGRTDATTGQWVVKAYSGSYGTNGNYLRFTSNSTVNSLGTDFSGNGNNFTANNMSITTYRDDMIDGPSFENYTTWDVNSPSRTTPRTLTYGNLREINSVAGAGFVRSTLGMKTGKWYAEFYPLASGTPTECMFGIIQMDALFNNYPGSDNFGIAYRGSNGNTYKNGSATTYGNTFTSGDTIGIAFDADNGKIFFSKNNVWQNAGDPVAGTNPAYSSISTDQPWHFCSGSQAFAREAAANFGQYPFTYTAPTGYKTLNSYNLGIPAIINPSLFFDVALHNGAVVPVVVNSLLFSPNFLWIKQRNDNVSHYLFDTSRSSNIPIFSNSTGAEGAAIVGLTLDANGYTLPANTTGISTNSGTFVGWNWKENVTAGFDIVTYTGDNTTNRLIGHNLGAAPEFALIKSRATGSWYQWHRDYGLLGQNYYGISDSSSGVIGPINTNSPFGTGSWTTTDFMVTNNATNNLNNTAVNYVAYLWRSIPGYSSIFSFVGNGHPDGPMVYTGFSPKYFMYFVAAPGDSGSPIIDISRSPFNAADKLVSKHLANAEISSFDFYILSNGFKIGTGQTALNWSANKIYGMAFAEVPFKYARSR